MGQTTRWRSLLVAVFIATVGLGTVPAATPTSLDAADLVCEPLLEATVNGGPIDEVAPPDGTTESDTLLFNVTAGFDGEDCPDALNRPPALLGGWLDRPITYVTDDFRYDVVYFDADNDPPASIVGWLDGTEAFELQPRDPADTDYTDGARYTLGLGDRFVDGAWVPDVFAGEHWLRVEASDGRAAAEPVVIQGPILYEPTAGSFLLPNPANRLVIHPIGNGPTLTPPSELPPGLGHAVPAADGVYSYHVPIHPAAGDLGAEWSVSTGSHFGLLGYGLLEGEPTPANGFEIGGAAAIDPRAHVGDQAVDLLAVPGSGPGVVRAFPNSDTFHFANVGALRVHSNWTSPSAPDATIGVWLELDRDGDGAGDVCVGTPLAVPAGTGWRFFEIDRQSPVRVLEAGCTIDVTPTGDDGVTTLDEAEDHVEWALLPVVALRVEASPEASLPPGDALLVDSLGILPGFSRTVGDVDACLYAPSDEPTASPIGPAACQSDLGPNSGIVPVGADRANVWADRMFPQLDFETLLPERPYLEPLPFSFTYTAFVRSGPAFEVPPQAEGRLVLWQDSDQDGTPDSAAALWDSGPLPVGQTTEVQAHVAFDGPDGVYGFVWTYETGRADEIIGLPFAVQRFVNDAPAASLDATTHAPHRTVTFFPAATDADDGQGEVAPRFGGLRTWTLDFGDGASVDGTFPLPASVEHSYKTPGLYVASLTVQDAAGLSAEDQAAVDLTPGAPAG